MMKSTTSTILFPLLLVVASSVISDARPFCLFMCKPKPAPKPVPVPVPIPVPAPVPVPIPVPVPVPVPVPAPVRTGRAICQDLPVNYTKAVARIISTADDATKLAQIFVGVDQYSAEVVTIGSTTQLIAEASDAAATNITIVDGKSGNIAFPHGNLKPIATFGERSVCNESEGQKLAGVPDGIGAYLLDNSTVRIVVQSESYGPLQFGYSWPFNVNNGTLITGSHIYYLDYDRTLMEGFMSSKDPASSMIVGFGQMIEKAYNLKGQLIGKRNKTDANSMSAAPMFSNTDKDGVWRVATPIANEADWFYQSFCSAHLDQRYQWGPNIGLVDDIFITNEEWNRYTAAPFVGLSAHTLDIKNKALYATGVFTMGGFEKIFELNPQHPDYVVFGLSGYNGDFGAGFPYASNQRNAVFGPKPDGTNYVATTHIVPFRIYVGVKGKKEDGTSADPSDFLARNGLRYGRLYGYAIDMTPSGPTGGIFRDAFHASAAANNGKKIPGKWIRQNWTWDGVVRNFEYDGGWEYQLPTGVTNYSWWNAGGLNVSGCKTEHGSPDPRPNITGYVQGSTCGYFGHLYVDDIVNKLTSAGGNFPSEFDGQYYVYQGVRSVVDQIELNGAGILAGGRDARKNWNSKGYQNGAGNGTLSLDNNDGMEVIRDSTGSLYAIIQEDASSYLGDRMLITKLEHLDDGKELKYFYVAMSGGNANSRIVARAAVPRGTGELLEPHEFSGIFDLSAFFYKVNGTYALSSAGTGKDKRDADSKVHINSKLIAINLQAHSMTAGIIRTFRGDRGGQIYMYQPNVSAFN